MTPPPWYDILSLLANKTDLAVDQFCNQSKLFRERLLPRQIPSPSLPISKPPYKTKTRHTYERKTLENLAEVVSYIRQNHPSNTQKKLLVEDVVQHFETQNRSDLAALAAQPPYKAFLAHNRGKNRYRLFTKTTYTNEFYLPNSEPWDNLASIFNAYANMQGYAPIKSFLACFYTFYPNFDHQHLPAETPTLQTLFQTFTGTFDTQSNPDYLKLLGSINNPDPKQVHLDSRRILHQKDLEHLAILMSLANRKGSFLNLSPTQFWDLFVQERRTVPGIHSPEDIANFLNRFSQSGFYRLNAKGNLQQWGNSKKNQRIVMIQNIIEVIAQPNGHAPLALTAYLATKLYPPLRWQSPTKDLRTYVQSLRSRPFRITLTGSIIDNRPSKLSFLPANCLSEYEARIQALKDAARRQRMLTNQPGPVTQQITKLLLFNFKVTSSLLQQTCTPLLKTVDFLIDWATPPPLPIQPATAKLRMSKEPKTRPEQFEQPTQEQPQEELAIQPTTAKLRMSKKSNFPLSPKLRKQRFWAKPPEEQQTWSPPPPKPQEEQTSSPPPPKSGKQQTRTKPPEEQQTWFTPPPKPQEEQISNSTNNRPGPNLQENDRPGLLLEYHPLGFRLTKRKLTCHPNFRWILMSGVPVYLSFGPCTPHMTNKPTHLST